MSTSTPSLFRSAAFHPLVLGLLVTACTGLLGGTLVPQAASAQNTYVVDSNGDADDNNLGDGTCATSGGNCTLRAAIREANQTTNNDDIEFNLSTTAGFATIVPGNEYRIEEPVTIDATTQAEYPSAVDGPVVILDGSDLSASSDDGIEVAAPDVTIRGLAVNSFPDEGIQGFSVADNVTIEDCFVGIAADDGKSDAGNGTNPDGGRDAGISLQGDDFLIDNNVISHHNGDGVYIEGGSTSTVDVLQGNRIGLDHDGDAAAGNSGAGVRVAGGTEVAVGFFGPNYISANGGPGVVVEAAGHLIINNYIGTDMAGTTTTGTGGNDLGNGEDGVVVGADNTDIENNLISGNSREGIQVGATGSPADNTTITNNDIGVNASADAPLPNGLDGIDVIEGSGTTIDGNVVGGNSADGIEISAVNPNTDARTVITGNYVGTNSSGDDLGNWRDGIKVLADPSFGSREVEIFDGNVIGYNGLDGIQLNGGLHDVGGNFVGTNPNGDDLGNGDVGIEVNSTSSTLSIGFGITTASGGAAAVVPNVVGYNEGDGIAITDGGDHLIRGNYVGTNATGDNLGNDGNGVLIQATSGNNADGSEVGYGAGDTVPDDPSPASAGRGNVIANNGGSGVVLTGDGDPVGNAVRGNLISNNGAADQTDIGIDLDGDGVTPSDAGDTDTGTNNLQNFPEIDRNQTEYNTSTGKVEVRYKVSCNTTDCDYGTNGLKIDIYLADSESSGEGLTYLYTDEYPEASATSFRVISFDPPSGVSVSRSDFIVATATDASGNTSEFTEPPATQLPVEIASFEARQSGEDVVDLSWTTASETGNAGFVVQRRDVQSGGAETASEGNLEGGAWQRVAYVESNASGGTTTEAQTYRFAADDLAVGTHQFRLKQRDLDGTEHLHDPVTVELTMEEALQLSAPAPNPVQNRATVSFAVRDQAEATITLYNTLGQVVRTLYRGTPGAGEGQTVDVSTTGLSSGVYFLRLRADGRTETQRLTVVR